MRAILFIIILAMPVSVFGQFTISGKVLNKVDKKEIPAASVFLSNATIGGVTSDDGFFTLKNVKPGKYDLVVSVVGFDTFGETVIISDKDIILPPIALSARAVALKEVKIQANIDPNREVYMDMFKDEFLGTSELAKECKIVNPDVLDFDYDDKEKKLSATSYDFLVIENDALGYRIKYLLKDFSVQTKDPNEKRVFYKGPYLFEQIKGTAGEERRWERRRLQVYENSPMHFFRALMHDRLAQENFLVKKRVIVLNRERQPESKITERINYYKNVASHNALQHDSLDYWLKKQKLPAKFEVLVPDSLTRKNLVEPGAQSGQYDLNTDNDGLVISYKQGRNFHMADQLKDLYNASNDETTLAKCNLPFVSFFTNGVLTDPYSLTYFGVWGRHRVAELLPIDYEPPVYSDDIAPEEKITAKLRDYNLINPSEKAYLQFNQPYYAAGDTMYFKAYATMGERHNFSTLSGVLHVDLINAKSKIDQRIQLQLVNGVAWGDFALPDSLRKGNYRVRAWTRWMRNDSTGFFEKIIPISSIKAAKVPESAAARTNTAQATPDLQFFPEGGLMVAGISNRIAFKVVGPNGLGLDVKGQILDDDNKEVAVFSSSHLGMGSFMLDPQEGRTYKAQVTYANGASSEAALPKALDKGITLSVNTDSVQKVTVKLEANSSYYAANKDNDYTLLLYSGGVARTIDCLLDSNILTIDLVKRKLFTGVNTITLFTAKGELIAERLFFIQNYDQLNLNIGADKETYHPREKVSLMLLAKTRADSAAIGHFSVSVTDEGKVQTNEGSEKTILSDLLLTSNLKGYVEQPNYYFTSDTTGRKQKELDLVMLTHGYRRFTWKKVLSDTLTQPQYQPENDLEINGTVTNLFGRPVVKGAVTLLSKMGGPIVTIQTDSRGNFSFGGLIFRDTAHFVLSSVNQKGKNTVKLTYKPGNISPFVVNHFVVTADSNSMARYNENHTAQWNDYAKYGSPQGHLLQEVKIKGFKDEDIHYPSSSLLGPGHADQVMHADEIGQIGGAFSTSLNGRLHGITFVYGRNGGVAWLTDELHTLHPVPMYVVIDGAEMGNGYSVDNIRSTDVETVEVLRFASASIYGSDGAAGALVITTKLGSGLASKDIPSEGVLPITAKGFYVARQFYSPKYEVVDAANKRPDLRSTIYWKPELITDAAGTGTIEYYNADGKGTYRVVVEGIDVNGNIGRLVYRYKVE